jgi:hypothetical protein
MSEYHFQKHTEDDKGIDGIPPGFYMVRPTEYRLWIFLCCPLCKAVATLVHDVDAQGNVSHPEGNSLKCPYPPCEMHVNPVRLIGWTYGVRPRTK